MKAIHVKPAFYTYFLEKMKEAAKRYGYNLVIHGSLNRDMDIILIPWVEELGEVDRLIDEIAALTGGQVLLQSEEQRKCFPHGRESYVINFNRGGYWNNYGDSQYYFDVSVIRT
jgi:hypothetical protein